MNSILPRRIDKNIQEEGVKKHKEMQECLIWKYVTNFIHYLQFPDTIYFQSMHIDLVFKTSNFNISTFIRICAEIYQNLYFSNENGMSLKWFGNPE